MMLTSLDWVYLFPVALGWALVSPALQRLGLWKPRPMELVDMRGQVVIVTGANTGIGKRTAASLAAMGAEVVLACRSAERAESAKADIDKELRHKAEGGQPYAKVGKVVVRILDLGSLRAVGDFAREIRASYKRLDVLVCNAGLTAVEGKTKDGVDMVWGVNYLGHFKLLQELLPLLKATEGSRIVNLSSLMHQFGCLDFRGAAVGRYSSLFHRVQSSTYSDSKLAMVLLTLELRRRLQGTSCLAMAVNPGAVSSDIWRSFSPLYKALVLDPLKRLAFLDNEQGCSTSVAAATLPWPSPAPLYVTPYWCPRGFLMPFDILGPYYGWQEAEPRLPRNAGKAALELWEFSEKLVTEAEKQVTR